MLLDCYVLEQAAQGVMVESMAESGCRSCPVQVIL
jgi:hypothetical protein